MNHFCDVGSREWIGQAAQGHVLFVVSEHKTCVSWLDLCMLSQRVAFDCMFVCVLMFSNLSGEHRLRTGGS